MGKYLTALEADEVEIAAAGAAFEDAKARLEVAATRYAALRDFLTTQLGRSPYAAGIDWPEHPDRWGPPDTRGKFRFMGLKVADAVEQALREYPGRGFTLDDLVTVLTDGGLGFPEPVQARSVNAALLKLPNGIRKGVFAGGPRKDQSCYFWPESAPPGAQSFQPPEEPELPDFGEPPPEDEGGSDLDDLPFE